MTANDKRHDGRPEPELGPRNQPRPWRCSSKDAIFCTHHGDCCCVPGDWRSKIGCALHAGNSRHPLPEPVLKQPSWRT